MSSPDTSRLDALLRFRRFKRETSALALQQAIGRHLQAQQATAGALRELAAVSAWKNTADAGGVLQLAHYQNALQLEIYQAGQVQQAEGHEEQTSEQRQGASGHHKRNANAVRVVEQRREREAARLAHAEAHRQADEVADAWLARRIHDQV
jgi:flagellar biosynthesis chaperone FliJ